MSAGRAIRIIHLEDISDETEIIQRVMRKSDLKFEWQWVSTKESYVVALEEFRPDIVLSDHSMPGFSSVEAFRMLREKRKEIPFILVTATVSEEFAVMMMKEGIADYVLKDRLQRLPQAVENALEKWDAERKNKAYINQIIASQANLQAIMDNSSVHIYSLDRAFRYVTFNSLLKESIRIGYGLEIKAGDVVFDFLEKQDPRHGDEWREVYMLALQGVSQQFVREFEVQGYQVFMSFHVNPVREGDMITGLACFALDITKEKHAELSLARNEARYRALIENNYDAIVLRDKDKKLLYASPSVSRMVGYTNEEMMENNILVFHPDDVGMMSFIFANILINPNTPFPATARVRHKLGHYIWTEGVITNMLSNENVKGIVANYRDVTERKETEIHKAQMTRDLVQRNKDLEEFAYIVSHNLRAPVANILGIANLLRYKEITEKDRLDALKGIFSATKRLDEVVRDLNNILQTNHAINDEKEIVDFQELVDDISLSMRVMIIKNHVKVTTDFSEVKQISTIRSLLYSVFYNLISNSIKFKKTEVDPEIRVESFQHTDGVRLVFSDNGMGIDLELLGSKVFGLYQRFHHKHAEGKGMGLFMVKTQIGNLGGEVTIKSEVNKGTEVTVIL